MVFINLKRQCLFVGLLATALTITACNSTTEEKEKSTPFVKGEKITSANFIGTVWLNHLVETDTTHHVNIGSVTFEPGARTNWHYHEGGQILLVTDGKGLYQERGKPVEVIQVGEVIKCPPNIAHWHGATPTDPMTHIAIGTNTQIGGAVWLEAVTDEEFTAIHDK